METSLSSDVTPKRKRVEAAATPDIKRKRLKKRRERRRTSSVEHRSTSASPKCDDCSSEESDSFYQEAPHLRATVSLQWRHFQVRLLQKKYTLTSKGAQFMAKIVYCSAHSAQEFLVLDGNQLRKHHSF